MIKKIVSVKEASLRLKSKPVERIDKKIAALIHDLKDTLQAQNDPEGVGLAAPQIGKNLRIFILKDKDNLKAVINPKVVSISKKKGKNEKVMEGCLSLPHFYGPVVRAASIKISYLDELGKKITEKFEGFSAQIVQHELDHLDGVLFVDHLIQLKKPLYRLSKKGEWEEVELI